MAMAGGRFHAPSLHRRLADAASSARWASRARCGSAIARSSTPIADGRGARGAVRGDGRAHGYERGKAINMAATLEIDAVIDPAETRDWLARGLDSARVGERAPRGIDPW